MLATTLAGFALVLVAIEGFIPGTDIFRISLSGEHPREVAEIVNTVMRVYLDQFVNAAAALGINVESVAAETSGDVPDAALALCTRKIDALCQVPGNLTASAFPGIVRAAQSAKLPLFGGLSSQAKAGACVVAARDYFDAGIDACLMAARLMRGESPGGIPIESFSKTKIIVNLPAAKACGLIVPPALIQQASSVIGSAPVRSQ